MTERRMEDYMALAKPQGTHPHESEMNSSPKKKCCGYRVLLSSPSVLAIDFTVFVRFIPFYFHQGKLGCQDLLTRNKPLSSLMIITFQGWLQKAPRLCVTGIEAAGFYTPLTATLPVPHRVHLHPADQPAEDKARNLCLNDTCPPSPLAPKALQACPTVQTTIPLKSIPFSCPCSKPGDPQGRHGTKTWVHAWFKTTLALTLKCNMGFSIYFFTGSVSGHFMRKKQNIKRDTLKATET